LTLFYWLRRPPTSPLFPYTTLFRSHVDLGRPHPGPSLGDLLRDGRRLRRLRPRGRAAGHRHRVLAAHAPRPLSHPARGAVRAERSEEHTSELQSLAYLVCRLLLEKK